MAFFNVAEILPKLVKRLGGITKESAESTLKEVTESANREIEKLGNELANTKNQMTGMEDTFKKTTEQLRSNLDSANNELKQTEAALKKAKSTKRAERTLKNGNREVRKANKNGASMTNEYNPNDILVSSRTELLSGEVRHTTYDPVTGKRVRTFDNASGEEFLTEYDINGKAKSNRKVKNKKMKTKPQLVKKGEFVRSLGGETTLKDTYSDGSYVLQTVKSGYEKPIKEVKYNSENKKVLEKTFDGNYERIDKFNPETGLIKYSEGRSSNGDYSKINYNEFGNSTKVKAKKDGILRTQKREYHADGKTIKTETIELKYPKESEIASVKMDVGPNSEGYWWSKKTTIKLKDGREFEVTPDYGSTCTLTEKGKEPITVEINSSPFGHWYDVEIAEELKKMGFDLGIIRYPNQLRAVW